LVDDLQVYSVGITAGQAAGLFANPGKTVPELEETPPDFRITTYSFDPATRTSTLTWNSRPGKTYSVFTSSSLAASGEGAWSLLAPNQPSAGATTSFTEINAPAPANVRFYRIVEN
jgi:uncharacterized protein YigE (DUF2233 family)